jgi:hypothetical protein
MNRPKDNWQVFRRNFAIHEEDMLAEGARQIPAVVFMNQRTGELKLFSRKMTERIGSNNLEFSPLPPKPSRKTKGRKSTKPCT